MPLFDTYQKASFLGIEFPVKSVRMKASYRHYEHVYLKTPGASVEKLSRGLYQVDMQAPFDTNIRGYGNLPSRLRALNRAFASGTTGPLVIPFVGTMPAFQIDWDEEMETKIRSGQMARLVFKEDQNVAFLQEAQRRASSTSAPLAHDSFQLQAATISPRPSLFDQIQEAANNVFGFFDQAQLQQSLFAAKIESLTQLLRRAENDVEALQSPANWQLSYALQDLLSATLALARDVAQAQGDAHIYTVPSTMTVMQISVAIFNDTSHFADIVNANTIDDPYEVIAGTQIIYFDRGVLNAA